MAMATGSWDIPTDVLLEILLRLPQISLRRSRLVCRLWRDTVDERTAEMQSRAKALLWDTYAKVAYVVDDLSTSSTGTCTELWRSDAVERRHTVTFTGLWRTEGALRRYVELVGTCNGLLCMCNDEEIGGVITLVNPATGETLPLPPLVCASKFVAGAFQGKQWHVAYNLAYHPTSGRYKVVHVPFSFGQVSGFNGVHVFALGEASWREVPVGLKGGARCNLSAGVISIDGATYWVTEGAAARVVSFDLEDERTRNVIALPWRPPRADRYHLTEVHGRLGIVICGLSVIMSAEVWVVEKGRRWSRRYSLSGLRIPRPHFAYGGCVLTGGGNRVYGHHRRIGPLLPGDVVRFNHREKPTLVAQLHGPYQLNRNFTFTYVKTTEPLSVYVPK